MYLIERILHEPYFPRPKTGGLIFLSLNYFLFQFAMGMVALFGVIFIYELGQGRMDGLSFILVYFALQRVFVAVFIPFVAKIVSLFGYRWTVFVGLIAMVGKLLLLTQITKGVLWPIFPSAILGGLAIPAYYLPFHALFLDDNSEKKIGEQYGLIMMLGGFAAVLSPFVAGLVIETFGFTAMFFLAVSLFVISIIPLFLMKFHKRHDGSYSFSAIWRFILTRKKLSWSLFAWWFTGGLQAFFWPIYLFLVLGSYLKFGIVGSVVMFVNSIAVYLVGKIYDRKRASRLFRNASIVVSLTWVMRFLAKSPLWVSTSDVINRIASPPWWMKIKRQELLAGEKVDSLVFGAAHEYLVTLAFLIALPVGYAILIATNLSWPWLIPLAVLGTIIPTWLLRND